MKILLVGNGKSLLTRKIGEEIDKFDYVVRFNNFNIEGFEHLVGTKTDAIARRACDDVALWDSDTLKNVYVFCTYSPYVQGELRVAQMVQQKYKDRTIIVDPNVCKQIGEDVGLKGQPNKEWLSVGALTLGYFLKYLMHDKIWICGFDGVDKYGKLWKYNRVPKDDKYHNWKKEGEYLQNFIDGGRIGVL